MKRMKIILRHALRHLEPQFVYASHDHERNEEKKRQLTTIQFVKLLNWFRLVWGLLFFFPGFEAA